MSNASQKPPFTTDDPIAANAVRDPLLSYDSNDRAVASGNRKLPLSASGRNIRNRHQGQPKHRGRLRYPLVIAPSLLETGM
jgi:hypothetical protein